MPECKNCGRSYGNNMLIVLRRGKGKDKLCVTCRNAFLSGDIDFFNAMQGIKGFLEQGKGVVNG